jgi:pimeloyl-ACP methyl ester carboxylesterase
MDLDPNLPHYLLGHSLGAGTVEEILLLNQNSIRRLNLIGITLGSPKPRALATIDVMHQNDPIQHLGNRETDLALPLLEAHGAPGNIRAFADLFFPM